VLKTVETGWFLSRTNCLHYSAPLVKRRERFAYRRCNGFIVFVTSYQEQSKDPRSKNSTDQLVSEENLCVKDIPERFRFVVSGSPVREHVDKNA